MNTQENMQTVETPAVEYAGVQAWDYSVAPATLIAEWFKHDKKLANLLAAEIAPAPAHRTPNMDGGYGDLPYAPANTPPANTYYVAKPNNAECKRDGNDLGRAVTLILQLLPLVDGTHLLPQESNNIQQLLLEAAYQIEIAASTPHNKAKIGFAG